VDVVDKVEDMVEEELETALDVEVLVDDVVIVEDLVEEEVTGAVHVKS
jgi:hypothetical protein